MKCLVDNSIVRYYGKELIFKNVYGSRGKKHLAVEPGVPVGKDGDASAISDVGSEGVARQQSELGFAKQDI
jgi:hypothetical protein